MTSSIRQQRQALRRQRRQQHQVHRQGARRRRSLSPHLGRRVRSSDIYSLDERQRHIAEAILGRRHQAELLSEQPLTAEPPPISEPPPTAESPPSQEQ